MSYAVLSLDGRLQKLIEIWRHYSPSARIDCKIVISAHCYYFSFLLLLDPTKVKWWKHTLKKENHPWVFDIHICVKESRMYQENTSDNCLNIITTSTEDGAFQKSGHSARILSPEEAEKLAKDQVLVSEFKQLKLEKEAQKNWDLFYKRNSTNFFKDRHWTTREFEELKACREVRSIHFLLKRWDWLFQNDLIILKTKVLV